MPSFPSMFTVRHHSSPSSKFSNVNFFNFFSLLLFLSSFQNNVGKGAGEEAGKTSSSASSAAALEIPTNALEEEQAIIYRLLHSEDNAAGEQYGKFNRGRR